jgi:hypothetical protein
MKVTGIALWIGCGLALYIFEIIWLYRWWGDIGVIVGVFVPPIAAVFPFLYLLKEGFSPMYFGLLAGGILGLLITGSSSR